VCFFTVVFLEDSKTYDNNEIVQIVRLLLFAKHCVFILKMMVSPCTGTCVYGLPFKIDLLMLLNHIHNHFACFDIFPIEVISKSKYFMAL